MDSLKQFKLKKLVDLAQSYADTFSPCRKKKNAAIIITPTGQSVFGVNHIPEGEDPAICDRCPRMGKTSGVWDPAAEECPVIHAEPAAVYQAARLGLSVGGGSMLSLYFPCMPCARTIVETGLVELYYRDPYDGPEFVRVADYLKRAKVKVFKV